MNCAMVSCIKGLRRRVGRAAEDFLIASWCSRQLEAFVRRVTIYFPDRFLVVADDVSCILMLKMIFQEITDGDPVRHKFVGTGYNLQRA